jgi:hypothetical protein
VGLALRGKIKVKGLVNMVRFLEISVTGTIENTNDLSYAKRRRHRKGPFRDCRNRVIIQNGENPYVYRAVRCTSENQRRTANDRCSRSLFAFSHACTGPRVVLGIPSTPSA